MLCRFLQLFQYLTDFLDPLLIFVPQTHMLPEAELLAIACIDRTVVLGERIDASNPRSADVLADFAQCLTIDLFHLLLLSNTQGFVLLLAETQCAFAIWESRTTLHAEQISYWQKGLSGFDELVCGIYVLQSRQVGNRVLDYDLRRAFDFI